MFFRSFFDEKLAQYSYMVGCQRTGEAIIVDPAREITPYLETAKKEGFTISAVTETHIHADFVSGARQLATELGAKLYLSDEGDENWKYLYTEGLDVELVKEGSIFKVGNVKFEVLHTPGHTPESISFVLTDIGGGSDVPMGIFTGDFVFVGDIGRPDLLEKAAGVAGTSESGARQMFQSLNKFKELPDYLVVWPGHGAGSACGKSLGAVPISTVGYEKENNWALKHTDEEAFVAELLEDQPEPPRYFAMMKKVNKEGPTVLTGEEIPVIDDRKEMERLLEDENTILLDTRKASEFAEKHVLGALNLPYNKAFTNWAGWLVSYDAKYVVIGEVELFQEIQESLESIHLDGAIAYVPAEIVEQYSADETTGYSFITMEELEKVYAGEDYYVVDIRKATEWRDGHLPHAHHHMLGDLYESAGEIPKDKKVVVHCQSGTRSAIGTSLLQGLGFDVVNYAGGYAEWEREQKPVERG
ncbi:Zn-dependent hydrolase [Bacillus coahuilensis m2-6]|uniref:MBL fold metallo-hydrolase n=1 Tax=Bacillus coahuilensis TaxID=408580 RepID=UPI0007504A9E|nr:MBL fold metallo-hydrolase [Bacillus coahuilensis]KUP05674.1 Zn-dependent hydrolase [Bacillus coahuilensis m2-6]